MSIEIDLPRALETARRAVAVASQAALRYFRGGVAVEWKSDHSPVTAADRDAEAAILAEIRKDFRDHEILTEESGTHGGNPGCRWIVDPLDGTRGFARGGTFWGPLVALEHNDEVVAGAMALPALGESYWAARGLGCFLNGARLRVSSISDWAEATVSLGEIRALLAPPRGEAVGDLMRTAASVRCYGDLAGCAMVLTGRAEAWLEAGVRVWDLAPQWILVEEAGGRFTDFAGRRSLESGTAIATNGLVHEHVLRALTHVGQLPQPRDHDATR
jgi:histidinol-phosphatase